MDDHAIVAPGRFERYISGSDVIQDALRIALEGTPETPTAADFDQEALSDVETDMTDGFSRREFLYGAVFAHYAEAIRHCVFAAMKTPRCANCSLHGRLNAAGREQADFLSHAQPAAKSARPTGILPQLPIGDKDRCPALAGLDRSVVRVAVVDAKGCALTVRVAQRAPAAAGQHGREMKRAAGLRIETEDPRRREVGVVAGEHVVRAGPSEGLENRVRNRHWNRHPRAHWRRFGGADDPAGRQNNFQRPE